MKKRSKSEWLFAGYLGILVLGGAFIVFESDVNFGAGVSPATPYVLSALIGGLLLLQVTSALAGNAPIIADSPILLNVARRQKHVGVSLMGNILWRIFLLVISTSIVAGVVSQILVTNGSEFLFFVGKCIAVAITYTGISVSLQSKSKSVLMAGTCLSLASLIAVILLPKSEFNLWIMISFVAMAVVAIASLIASLESIPFANLLSQAEIFQTIATRFYLTTPLDICLLARTQSVGLRSSRLPIDGLVGLMRMVFLVAFVAMLISISPAEGFSFPLLIGVVAHIWALDLLISMRVNVLFHDIAPLTLPFHCVWQMALVWGGIATGTALAGLLIGILWVSAIGLCISCFAIGIATAMISATTRELQFVEVLLQGGPDALGAVILLRMFGPITLSGLGAIAMHHVHIQASIVGGIIGGSIFGAGIVLSLLSLRLRNV